MPYDAAFVGTKSIHDCWAKVTETHAEVEVRYGDPMVVGERAAVQ